MPLDRKLNRIKTQASSRLYNNLGDKVSSIIPNITSGLDIADNGVIKSAITGLLDDNLGSIFKPGSIKRAPSLIDIRGPSNNTLADYQMLQSVKLTHKVERVKAGDKNNKNDLDKDGKVKNIKYYVDEKLETEIILPFPQEISISTQPGWSGTHAGGLIGEKILENRLDSQGVPINESIIQKLSGSEVFAQTTSIGKHKLVDALASGLIGTDHFAKILDSADGKLLNPRNIILFDGIEFRTFTTSFNLAPQSRTESLQTAKFIQLIHEAAVPDIKGPYFTYPEFFKFSIVDHENKTILDRGDVVITSIECNYTPDGVWATFKNNQPVHIRLEISWLERELPTRSTIKRLFGGV